MNSATWRRTTTLGIVWLWALAGSADGAGPSAWQEVWAYLMAGEERLLTGREPVTDLCVFSARLDETGRLPDAAPRVKLPPEWHPRRRHLVISAPSSRTLMYLCLRADPAARDQLVTDIARLGRGYDGVQIDFETIRPEEAAAYLAFLGRVRAALAPGTLLSVAVPARTESRQDAFNYAAISALTDRVVVMAYDEHWRGGPAGTIASLAWVRRVVGYARSQVPAGKLVIGLPLYGRAWQTPDVARALKYPETLDLWRQADRPVVRRGPGQEPSFEFSVTVRAQVHYEDLTSLRAKLRALRDARIGAVAFWRLGQGPVALWDHLAAP